MDLSFLRAVLPAWNLFDAPGAVPRLWIRTTTREWWEWRPRYTRGPLALFTNGPGNLTLAYVSVLERLVRPDFNAADFEASADFAVLREFVRELAGDADDYQFRIDVFDPVTAKTETFFLSPEYRN